MVVWLMVFALLFFEYSPFLRITGMLGTYIGLALLAYEAVRIAV
jgi:hypothetical protein